MSKKAQIQRNEPYMYEPTIKSIFFKVQILYDKLYAYNKLQKHFPTVVLLM